MLTSKAVFAGPVVATRVLSPAGLYSSSPAVSGCGRIENSPPGSPAASRHPLSTTRSFQGILLQGLFSEQFFAKIPKEVKEVFVLEGRPSLKAVKDSAKQLQKRGLVPTVMADNMAGYLFYKSLVNEVWVACQSPSGDKKNAVCDIGGLIVAVLAKKHNIPLYGFKSKKAKQTSGKSSDLTKFNGREVLKGNVQAYVPLTESVPSKYFKGIYE